MKQSKIENDTNKMLEVFCKRINDTNKMLEVFCKWINDYYKDQKEEWNDITLKDFTTDEEYSGYSEYLGQIQIENGSYIATIDADYGDDGGPITLIGYFNEEGELENCCYVFDGIMTVVYNQEL